MDHAREDVCVRCASSTAPVWVRLERGGRAAWIARKRFKFEIDRSKKTKMMSPNSVGPTGT